MDKGQSGKPYFRFQDGLLNKPKYGEIWSIVVTSYTDNLPINVNYETLMAQ